MSKIRIGLVVEGVTDALVIEAALNRLLTGSLFTLTTLQPETPPCIRGEGWGGIYRWCRQIASTRSKTLLESPVLRQFDLLIMAIDADVAGKTYSSANVLCPVCNDLPCEKDCPPASDTTTQLVKAVKKWFSPLDIGQGVVICTPSKSIESWVVAALYAETKTDFSDTIECSRDLLQYMHAKPADERLVVRKSGRLRKRKNKYRWAQQSIARKWDDVEEFCSEAIAFRRSLEMAVARVH
jgi:hypothetical protein